MNCVCGRDFYRRDHGRDILQEIQFVTGNLSRILSECTLGAAIVYYI